MRERSAFAFGLLIIAALLTATFVLGSAYGRATSRELPQDAVAGGAVWRSYGCENCHTLYGQGGNYAPDLTHIIALRGDAYIREFLVNPAAVYPGERVMPRFTLTQAETDNLLAMLRWVDSETVAADDWPPRLIQVATGGGSIAQISDADDDPIITLGRTVYSQRCTPCHSLSPNVVIVGPSLYDIRTQAAKRVPGQSAEAYIRASILDPSAYVVEGFPDVMQKNFASVVGSREIDALITFLMTREG